MTRSSDRVFTRSVFEHHGPSIRHFMSGLHLLQILRDAIHGRTNCTARIPPLNIIFTAHYLLVKAGVLHRNTSPDNILIGKNNAPDGQHGVLIDLEQAIYCEKGRTPVDNDVPTVRIER